MKPRTAAKILFAWALCIVVAGCDGLIVTQQKRDVQTLAKTWPPYQAPQLAPLTPNAQLDRPGSTGRGQRPVLTQPATMTGIRPHTDWDLQQTAMDSLGRIGAAAVPELVEVLRDPDPAQRNNAARVLSRIGPEAAAAVPALTMALSDPEESVRQAAARALGQVGPDAKPAIRPLLQFMREGGTPSISD